MTEIDQRKATLGARHLDEELDVWRRRVSVSSQCVVLFARHLSVLIQASVPLVDSLECLRRQDDSPNFGVVIDDIVKRVSTGSSLSDSVKAYPKVFPPLFASMLRVGEGTGRLPESLERLADWLEKDQDIQRRLKGAVTYPCIVLVVAFIIVVGLFRYVIPQFVGIFESLGESLPLLTRVVLVCSNLVKNPGAWLLFAALVASGWHFLGEAWQTPTGRLKITRVLVRVPLLGEIMKKSALARFSAAAQMSLYSGLDLLACMRLASGASQNALILDDTERMVTSISEGGSLAEHMLANPELYDSMMIQTIQTGEESAMLEASFGHSAALYEEQTRYLLDGLGAALEPVLLLGVGILVGVLLLAIFLPMYTFVGNL